MTLLDFLVCDDIRFEQSNKISLMGIFSDDIIISFVGSNPTWPFPMRLCFFARLINIDPRANRFELKFQIDGKDVGKAAGSLAVSHPEKAVSLPIVANGFPLSEGQLSFELCIYSDDTLIESLSPPYTLAVSGSQASA